MNVKFVDIGIIDGLHTIQVIDEETNEVIGYNQKVETDA